MIRVGHTPLHALPLSGNAEGRCFAKLESENPTGSMKLRSAHRILTEAQLPSGTTIVESTSGNMGLALATVAQELGLDTVLVTDPKLSPYHRTMLERLGVCVFMVDAEDETGGWLLTRLNRVQELRVAHPTWFWTNQYANPWNPIAFEFIALELIRDLSPLTIYTTTTLWYFAAVSTGGSLTGSARALRRLCQPQRGVMPPFPIPQVRIVAVDAEGSAIFGRPPCTRYLNGIGSSLGQPPNLRRNLIDDVVIVTDAEAFAACHALRRKGTWVGGSSGAVWAAIQHKQAHFKPHDIIVGLFPDAGYIYKRTLYDPSWLQARGFTEIL